MFLEEGSSPRPPLPDTPWELWTLKFACVGLRAAQGHERAFRDGWSLPVGPRLSGFRRCASVSLSVTWRRGGGVGGGTPEAALST